MVMSGWDPSSLLIPGIANTPGFEGTNRDSLCNIPSPCRSVGHTRELLRHQAVEGTDDRVPGYLREGAHASTCVS